ncbi:ribosomal L7Ae/L30e/S12e/Gadd45 family protein [Candidatus Woesearchaeota archaeon]|nr:ribosomal L7Ae/L30e/S12e/Gadd45 family protein [Candidatus Woesearchaeota archaeon]
MTQDEKSEELKKALKDGHVAIGMNEVERKLKQGALRVVYVSSNCKPEQKENVAHYARLQDVAVIPLHMTSQELGVLCRKPFDISAIAIKRV